jgi:hypothetical protein
MSKTVSSAIIGAVAATLLAGVAGSAQAAPAFKPGLATDTSPVAEKVDYRQCVWRHGARRCWIVQTHRRHYYGGPRVGLYGYPWGPRTWGYGYHRGW